MEKTGFTQGPWTVGPVDDTVVTAIINGERVEIANIDGDYNQPETWPIMEANARLIASAPCLYEALKWAMAELRGKTRYDNPDQALSCFARADAALSKVEG